MNPKRDRQGLADYLRSHPHPGGIIACPARRFIYMKPAKTAGTSILRATLEKHIPGIIHHKDHPGQFREWLDAITDEDLAGYYIFSVVRNPWDRAVSLAAYLDIPFTDFVERFDEHCKTPNTQEHALPLSLYTHLGDTAFVDDICRFERLQADFSRIAANIGLGNVPLPHSNPSQHAHYSSYYRDSDIEKVGGIYRADIDHFGYAFEHAPAPAVAQAPAARSELRRSATRLAAFMPRSVVRGLGLRRFSYAGGSPPEPGQLSGIDAHTSPNFREQLAQLRPFQQGGETWLARDCVASGRLVTSAGGRILLDLFPVTINGDKQRYPVRWGAYLRCLAGGFRRGAPGVATGGVISTPFFNNYYHFLVDVLLRYAQAADEGTLPDDFIFVSTAPLRSFQARLVELLGIDVAVHDTVRVKELVVPPSQRQGLSYSAPALRTLRRLYLDKLGLGNDSPRGRIYISRRGASNRRITNEEELTALLRERGYQIVVPDALGVDAQIALFCSADVVVGPHGAGLANILFQHTPVLVELLPDDDFRWGHYAALCASLGGHYHNVIGSTVSGSDDFKVDLHAVGAALDRAESVRAQRSNP